MHRFLPFSRRQPENRKLSVSDLKTELGVSLNIHRQTADPEAQKKIWVEALGAEVTHAGTLELLRLPGIYIIVGKARTAPTEGTEGSTVHHIGFAVKDLAMVRGRLDALHVESAPVNGNRYKPDRRVKSSREGDGGADRGTWALDPSGDAYLPPVDAG